MKILILKEHYGNRYLDISTEEKLDAVALSVVKGRFGGDNDYYQLEEEVEEPKPPMTDAETAALPDSLKPEADKQMRRYVDSFRSWKKDKALRDRIRNCIANNDSREARRILQSRMSNEDEGFQIVGIDETY